ncbi:MAG: hypothetical protein AB7F35_25940, partial [Acetobacteraceae bacterium]
MLTKVFTPEELVPPSWMAAADGAVMAVFNPAIQRLGDHLVMAYRIVTPDHTRHIALCRLDADWNVLPGSVSVVSAAFDFADDEARPQGWAADPRLVELGGRLFMHVNSGSQPRPNRIFLVEIDPDTLRPAGRVREVVRTGRRRDIEKNWILFEHQGEVYAVYQFAPLVILRVDLSDPDRVVCTEAWRHAWDGQAYEETWGELRGGATP